MKLVFIIGDGAVGKMTVGRELAKLTELRLFHNHMTIEPVIEIMGHYEPKTVARLREVIFEDFAESDSYGMIFTYMWAFNFESDWDYIAHVIDIFRSRRPDTEVYCIELNATLEERLRRNKTAERLAEKPSKRDIALSDERLIRQDERYRLVSHEGELPFENYMRIVNTDIPADEAAAMIKARFGL